MLGSQRPLTVSSHANAKRCTVLLRNDRIASLSGNRRAGSLFFNEIDTIQGIRPGYFSLYAVAYPRVWPRQGKGGLHGRGKEQFI